MEDKGKRTVFYAWQSDLDNAINRGFIGDALEKAVSAIGKDETVAVEPRPEVDSDTRGLGGSPDIAKAILDKIDRATVFVADVSIINGVEEPKRATPNPNVLVELGYAMNGMGMERIIMVMNTAFGSPDDLPFDLRRNRTITYDLPDKKTDRTETRKVLIGHLKQNLLAILAGMEKGGFTSGASPLATAIESVEQGEPDHASRATKFMVHLAEDLERIAPDWSRPGEPDDLLVEAIEASVPQIIEMAQIAEAIATNRAGEAALAIYRGFEHILKHYNNPLGFSGVYDWHNFDFYKFMGHELFVSFVSFLVKDEHWDILSQMLDESPFIPNVDGASAGLVPFEYISQPVRLLGRRNQRLKKGKASLQAAMLHERHSNGRIAEAVPAEQFVDADYFLFLRSVLSREDVEHEPLWGAWSTIYLERRTPKFIVQTQSLRYANRLLQALKIPDVETFRERYSDRRFLNDRLFPQGTFYPLNVFDPRSIGTR